MLLPIWIQTLVRINQMANQKCVLLFFHFDLSWMFQTFVENHCLVWYCTWFKQHSIMWRMCESARARKMCIIWVPRRWNKKRYGNDESNQPIDQTRNTNRIEIKLNYFDRTSVWICIRCQWSQVFRSVLIFNYLCGDCVCVCVCCSGFHIWKTHKSF